MHYLCEPECTQSVTYARMCFGNSSAERTFRSVDESLQRMGVNYVDVIQVRNTCQSDCAIVIKYNMKFMTYTMLRTCI